jgi:hypothetical protein
VTEHSWITFDDALARLPDGDLIHVFTRNGMGADWDRQAVIDMLRTARIEVAGGMAGALGHGLAAWDEPRHVWLVETRRD